MSRAEPAAGDEQFTGKYENAGRIASWLLDGFFNGVAELIGKIPQAPSSALEIGCGAGFSTMRLRGILPPSTQLAGSELLPTLAAAAARRNPAVPVARESVYALARNDASIDLLFLLEVLEHLDDPDAALRELARVSRGHVIVSTPREPIWRVLNMARGKYLADLGNTPGHINHWSSRGLQTIVARHFDVVAVRRPLPWTIVLLRRRS